MNQQQKSEIKHAYTTASEKYAQNFFYELQNKPLSKKLYDLFYERVINTGKVLEIGCGPGEISNYLWMKGLNITGIDYSDGMIAIAKKYNPNIEFKIGDVFNLEYKDKSVSGIVAPYLIVNFTQEDLPKAFAEIYRVLKDDGVFMISFHIGNETIMVDNFFADNNPLRFQLFDPEVVSSLITECGFTITEKVTRSAYESEQTTRTYIFARK